MGNVSLATIAEIAPTLADLKRLSLEKQASLLLSRLAIVCSQTHNSSGLHKGNFLLPGDPFGLVSGYPETEKSAVCRYLLGAPWALLVNSGYLIDPAGNGFYEISDEGRAILERHDSSGGFTKRISADLIGADNEDRTMPRTAIVLNVLIASPSDVSKERDAVNDAIQAWNAANYENTGIMLYPVCWETHSYPESGDRPQAIVNRQIVDRGDFLIGIFGIRLGTPTGGAQSGTIEEIERFRDAGKYVALYFSTADVPRGADRDELAALEEYQREREKDTLYSTFRTPEELQVKVTQHLPHIVPEVYKRLTSSNELDGLEQELRNTQQHSGKRLQELADEHLIEDRESLERRISSAFDQTKPLIPEFVGDNPTPTLAYQSWVVRPRTSLKLRLDRALDTSIRAMMEKHFKTVVPGYFQQPITKGNSHIVRWFSRVSGDAHLTYVRYLEVTAEGAIRYCERIDRHDTRQESLSDLFIESLHFWNVLGEFLESQHYGGSLTVAHRIDCTSDVRLFGTFPDERGTYYKTNAIAFPDMRTYGVANGSSNTIKEIAKFKTQKDREELVAESMLAHLRELCGANIDYPELRKVIHTLPETAPVPRC